MNITTSFQTKIIATAVLVLLALQGVAAEVNWIKVSRDGGRVDVRSEFVIEASATDVHAALLSYDQFAQMGDTFAESRYLEPAADGTPRIYTRTEGCIAFFCKTIERYARIEIQSQDKIIVIADPERSDAELSVETWTLTPNGDSTIVGYRHELETGFWMPPLLGNMIIKRSVKSGTEKAAVRVEGLARAQRQVTLAKN